MRPGVIRQGERAGTRKATVERWPTYGSLGVTWLASHEECGWCDELTAWHNAFWAADHHVRYDCGRREQVSSGAVVMEMSGNLATLTESQMAEFRRRWEAGIPYGTSPAYLVLNEGGMQNDPTPSDNGHPLPPASAEDATVELGCITTDLGVVCDGDTISRGGTQAGYMPGWWAGLWGSSRGRAW